MNILFISHENNLGGATRSMLGVIDKLLINSENKVFVFVPKFNEETPQGKLTDELSLRGVEYIYLRSYWWMYPLKNKEKLKKRVVDFLKVFITYISSKKVAKFAKKRNIELVHSNSSVSCMGAFVAKSAKCKHIWHIREFGKEDHGYDFVLPKKMSISIMERNTDKFICISKAIYNKYIKLMPLSKFSTIYNGVDLNIEYKEPRLDIEKRYNLLICGRIKESKGQLEAVKAINLLKDEGYDKLKLYIAGVSSDQYLDVIKRYILDNDLEENIEFCGFIKDLTKIRKRMDFELVCSKMEAFGRVTIEAMLNSNPVIGANTGGTKELINNMENGLLYEQGSYKDLAEKIKILINDFELRRTISINEYKNSKVNYTTSANAKKIMLEYKELL